MGRGPDKAVLTALEAGVAALLGPDGDVLFDSFLASGDDPYPLEEIEACKASFRIPVGEEGSAQPTPKLAYALQGDPWPIWGVVLSAKNPSQEFTGRSGGIVKRKPDDVQCRAFVKITEPVISVFVHSLNPDVTRWQADLVEAILDSNTPSFLLRFPGFAFQGAQDLHPEQVFLPDGVWTRVSSWQFITHQAILVPVSAFQTLLQGTMYAGVKGEDQGNGVAGKIEAVRKADL